MTVAVVSTGGTIASTDTADGAGASPGLTGEDLVENVPGLETEVAAYQFSNIPSTHFTLEDAHELVERLREFEADGSVDGAVVTQGTDVLEEIAFFVDLCYGGSTPVVFTGAMRNQTLASPDGPGNLLASVRTAADSGARDRGVLVAFNDRVHRAVDVTKTHSMNTDSFRSPEFGAVAVHEEGRIRWRHDTAGPRETVSVDHERLTNAVHTAYATVDMVPTELPAPQDPAALCLATTGAGHIPPRIIPALRRLVRADVPVVVTSRCPQGRLARSTYDFEGSERTLRELGCYFSERNLQKTRVGAVVGLAAGSMDAVFDRPTL